ncbi:MAG: chromosomal replication initiator protein DnaA [Clostridia bacterium]|nr:chromosomal replication initiator protein DnaA [Clostridia bacterium]
MDELLSISLELRDELRKEIYYPQSTFDLWFGDLTLTSLTEDKAVFSTPTAIRRKVLSSRYYELIKKNLTKIIGFSVDIEIVSLEELAFAEVDEADIPKPDEDIEKRIEKEKKIAEVLKDTESEKKTLLDDYTFENFIEGSSNKFAKAACYAVANEPCVYNPLFIHGHSGLGKTHLLYAIMHHMKKKNPKLKIIYKTCETFINELIEAIKDGFTAPFKEKYRSADVLLIDDIQFIAGKVSTQEEFFYTFTALYESEKQIILTSDRPPMEIKPLTDRLRTRFEGGLIADVQPPSFELRVAIIKKKADDMGIVISNNLVDYMADRLNNNIRQIEGVLKRLYAVTSLEKKEVTKETIDGIISIVDPGNIPTDVMVDRILSATAKKYGVTVDDIKSKKKTDSIANARHCAVYIIRKLTNLSLKETGKIFGRDHTTALASEQKIILNMRTVKNFERDLNILIKEIKGN